MINENTDSDVIDNKECNHHVRNKNKCKKCENLLDDSLNNSLRIISNDISSMFDGIEACFKRIENIEEILFTHLKNLK